LVPFSFWLFEKDRGLKNKSFFDGRMPLVSRAIATQEMLIFQDLFWKNLILAGEVVKTDEFGVQQVYLTTQNKVSGTS
jgi:hypothetical protein